MNRTEFIEKSVEAIKSGLTVKTVSEDKKIMVYKCGSVIRVDIKGEIE